MPRRPRQSRCGAATILGAVGVVASCCRALASTGQHPARWTKVQPARPTGVLTGFADSQMPQRTDLTIPRFRFDSVQLAAAIATPTLPSGRWEPAKWNPPSARRGSGPLSPSGYPYPVQLYRHGASLSCICPTQVTPRCATRTLPSHHYEPSVRSMVWSFVSTPFSLGRSPGARGRI